jgi:predicted exporter
VLCAVLQAQLADDSQQMETAKQNAAAVNVLEEEVGTTVTVANFQSGVAGYQDYLRRRNQAALYIGSGQVQRSFRLALR